MLRIDKIKFFLFLLIFFHIACNFMILTADKSPLLGDQFNNFLKSGHIYSLVGGGENFPQKNTPYLFGLVDSIYPPLMYFGACLFFILGKLNVFYALFSVSLFFGVFIFYSFKTYALFMKKEEALWCSAVLSFVPGVYGFSRVLHVDFVLASMISAATYYLLLSMDTNKKEHWITAGVFAGLGFLSKQSVVIFMFPLWCYLFLNLCKNKINVRALLLYGVGCFAVGSFWYLLNMSNDNSLPLWALSRGLDFSKILITLRSYLKDLRMYLLGNVTFAAGFFSLAVVMFFNREKIKILFSFLVLFPLMFFSFFSDIYSVRYLLPFVFYLCFFLPLSFKIIFRKKRLQFLVAITFLVFLVVGYLSTNIKTKVFTSDDLILKDDKSGLLSSFSWNYDVSELQVILNEMNFSYKKVATLFNTIDTDYLRYALWKETAGSVLLKKEGLLEIFYGKSFSTFLKEYNVVLVKESNSVFLLEQNLFQKSFIDDTREKIEEFKNNPYGFVFKKKIKVTLGGKDYFYLVFISS